MDGAREQCQDSNLTWAIQNQILIFGYTRINAFIIGTIVNAKTKISTIFLDASIPILITFFVSALGADCITTPKTAMWTFSVTRTVLKKI